MKFILMLIVVGYIAWNGGGRWKLSLFETLFIGLTVGYLILK